MKNFNMSLCFLKNFRLIASLSLLALSSLVWSQETGVSSNSISGKDISLSDPELSLRYAKGRGLIYDCELKHWVCAGDIEYNRCKLKRKTANLDKEAILPCGVLKQFKSEKKCLNNLIKLTNRGDFSRFCLHKNEQKIQLNF